MRKPISPREGTWNSIRTHLRRDERRPAPLPRALHPRRLEAGASRTGEPGIRRGRPCRDAHHTMRRMRRPLLCAAQIEKIMTGAEDAAVDDARNDRMDLAAGDAHHDLVEDREALRRLVLEEQHTSLSMTREGKQVAIFESRANLCGLGRITRPLPRRRWRALSGTPRRTTEIHARHNQSRIPQTAVARAPPIRSRAPGAPAARTFRTRARPRCAPRESDRPARDTRGVPA